MLVLTLVALLTWSVTLLVPWPLLALLQVPLLGGVLLTLLTLLAWLVLLVLVRWLLQRRLRLLVLWSGWSIAVVRCLWTIPNVVIGTTTTKTPVAGLLTILYTVPSLPHAVHRTGADCCDCACCCCCGRCCCGV